MRGNVLALGKGRLGKRLGCRAFPKEKYPGRWRLLMEWIEEDLNPGAVVLDCGAGKGRIPYALSEKVRKIVGIDRSEDIRENRLIDEAYVCDACRMPFGNNTFDVIFAISVLEHVQFPDRFFGGDTENTQAGR